MQSSSPQHLLRRSVLNERCVRQTCVKLTSPKNDDSLLYLRCGHGERDNVKSARYDFSPLSYIKTTKIKAKSYRRNNYHKAMISRSSSPSKK